VDEQGDSIGRGSTAQDGSSFHHLAHVDLRQLAGDGWDGGMNLDIVVDPQEAVAVVRECSGGKSQH